MKPKSWWNERIGGWSSPTRLGVYQMLKSNERPFGLLSVAEQEVMRECEVEVYSFGWEPVPYPEFPIYLSYRVRSDFVPKYAEEPKPQLDPNEAPEGYVAVEAKKNTCCPHCDLWQNLRKCGQSPCHANLRNDKCEVYFVKKSDSEWGEWQECEVTDNAKSGFTISKIRFKKEK